MTESLKERYSNNLTIVPMTLFTYKSNKNLLMKAKLANFQINPQFLSDSIHLQLYDIDPNSNRSQVFW